VRIGDREIGRVGLGTNRLENTEGDRSFLRGAVEAGLDHVDTAHVYTSGESERTIGDALASVGEDVLVATKCGYNGGDEARLRGEVEQSLASLRTEAIDLLYLHRVDPKRPIEESVDVLAELAREGKARRIGISAVSIGEIGRAKEVTEIAAVQSHFNIEERKHDEVVDYCAVEGIPFVPYYPLRGNDKVVDEVAASHGASANQVKLAWLLQRSPVIAPIPGTRSLAHLEENLAASEIELSDEEFERLSDLA
jgi:aryl-alcohol dehydrogenase-like predicted oxidoreductase